MKRLKDILSYKRPHESTSERQFIDRFLGPYSPARLDHAALVIEVAGIAGRSRTLFSSHVDTVHLHPGRQTVHHSEVLDRFYKRDGEPLGADDGAGVWVMLEIIEQGVPANLCLQRNID